MSGWMIIVAGLMYAYVAFDQGMKGNIGMSIAYAGYAFSNVGLFMWAK